MTAPPGSGSRTTSAVARGGSSTAGAASMGAPSGPPLACSLRSRHCALCSAANRARAFWTAASACVPLSALLAKSVTAK
eukprot:5731233-Prymnesium_polylepis.1